MAVKHRYFDELLELENNNIFCGRAVETESKFLIIGTFNPDKNSCLKTNNAEWFYGRKKNNLWRYLPRAMGFESLHLTHRPHISEDEWKKFCLDNRIVFIDLIMSVETDIPLPDFGDNEVEARINHNLLNVTVFDIASAFAGITFEKVIYSLSWSDTKMKKLKKIRDNINEALISTGCIKNFNQIRYPNSPARNDSYNQWFGAVNN